MPLIFLSCLQMAFAHDSVRVLQCFIQFGSHEQRQVVFEELKGQQAALTASASTFIWYLSISGKTVLLCSTDNIIGLSKSQYGRHVVKKLLMYGWVNAVFLLLLFLVDDLQLFTCFLFALQYRNKSQRSDCVDMNKTEVSSCFLVCLDLSSVVIICAL